jgi:hypothetical protein
MYYRFSNKAVKMLRNDLLSLGLGDVAGTDAEEFTSVQTSASQMLREALTTPSFRDVFRSPDVLEGGQLSAFKAFLLLERIRLTFSSAGCPRKLEPSDKEYSLMLMQWAILYHRNQAEKIAKYLSCNIFSYLTHQEPLELLKLPFGWNRNSMGGGGWRGYIRMLRMQPCSEKKLRHAQSFLYLKKGTPVVSDAFIRESLIKHRKALSEERLVPEMVSIEHSPGDLEVFFLKREMRKRIRYVIEYIRRKNSTTVNSYREEETQKMEFDSLRFRKEFWEPSPNASYLKSRSKGGQASEIDFEDTGDYQEFFFDNRMVTLPILKPRITLEKEFRCCAVPILEPFKTRVITKGPANATYALKGLQLALWEMMKATPIFALIGRTVTGEDLPLLSQGEKYLSGDFSAATDNLSKWASETVGKELALQFDLPEGLIVASLCDNIIDYGDYADQDLQPFKQQNGQLMGSVLSFLVLNIVNAAMLWMVKAPLSHRYESLLEQSFRVNGDDSVCSMDEREKNRWYKFSESLGLIPSIGKTYYSSEFAIINSTCFFNGPEGLVRVPFLNGDYLQSFQGKGAQERSVFDLAAIQKDFMEGATFEEYKLFLSCHRDKMIWKAGTVNWFLPKSVGGLGLKFYGEELCDGIVEELYCSKGDLDRAYAKLSGWDPVRSIYKDRWKDDFCIRKSEANSYLERLGLRLRERKVVLERQDWIFSEKKSVGGVSSHYIKSIYGKVIRDDLDEKELHVRTPYKYCNRSMKDWGKLLNKRLTGVMLKSFLKSCRPSIERLAAMTEYESEESDVEVSSLYTSDCSIGLTQSGPEEEFLSRERLFQLFEGELQGTVLEDLEGDTIRPKIPKGTSESPYRDWIWSLNDEWLEKRCEDSA